MDKAFEQYRKEHFGAYEPYPVEAYTYFCAGWRAGANAMYKAAVGDLPTRADYPR